MRSAAGRAEFLKTRVWIFPGLSMLALAAGHFCGRACESLRGDILGVELTVLGFVFYAGLFLVSFFENRFKGFLFPLAAVLASAGIGTEIILVRFMVQNNTYCPKCLASGFFLLIFFLFVAGRLRKWLVALLVLIGAVFTLFTFNGTVVPLYAAELRYPVFGNQKSNTEIILYSDYLCPVCRAAEPKVDELLLKLQDRAKIELVDVPIHKNSAEYSEIFLFTLFAAREPGLSEAIRARQLLFEAGASGMSPGDAFNSLRSKGVQMDPDKELTRKVLTQFYNTLLQKDSVHSTPNLVIVRGGERKKYVGAEKIISALQALVR